MFNPEGLGGLTSTFRWSPLVGCKAPSVAIERAGDLLAGVKVSNGVEDRNFWESNAAKVLRCYLFAAAVSGRTMADVADWAGDATDRTPFRILTNHPGTPPGWAEGLQQIIEGPERTRGSVFMTLSLVFEFMADPALAQAVLPRPGEETFSVGRFLKQKGTLYLIAEDRPYGSLAPLYTAFVSYLHRSAKVLAERQRGRLDPPLLLALDEAPLICPVPLERWTSDGGGRGIPVVISVQGRAWLDHRWGNSAARIIWNNATSKLMFGGTTDEEHLGEVSRLCGERDEHVTHPGRQGEPSSTQVRRVPVLSYEALRTLGQFEAVLLHRSTRPVIVRIRPVWKRADVKRANNAVVVTAPPRPRPAPIPREAPRRVPDEKLAPVVELDTERHRTKAGEGDQDEAEAAGE